MTNARRKKTDAPAPKQNPGDAVEQWDIDRLLPFPRNSRTHSDAQIAQIAAAIKEWGWTTPVLINPDGMIIAGHGRVLAGRKLGLTTCPVMIARDWTPAQVRAYVIADNKLAMNAGWDLEMLGVELDDLRDAKFQVALLGFEAQELNDLIGTPRMPPPPNTNAQLGGGFKFSVIIEAKDEAHQAELIERFEQEGMQCRPLITQ